MTIDEYPDAPNGMDSRADGEKYQEFVRGLLNPWGITIWNWADKKQQMMAGENPQGFEIKLDRRCYSADPNNKPTGRLSIEIQEKTRLANTIWTDSGILRADNAWAYAQGNYEIVFLFAKNWLRRVYHQTITPEDIHEWRTVRKFYLPIPNALIGAALVLDGDGEALRKDEKGQWRLP